jgi:hypothetical protein
VFKKLGMFLSKVTILVKDLGDKTQRLLRNYFQSERAVKDFVDGTVGAWKLLTKGEYTPLLVEVYGMKTQLSLTVFLSY